MDNETNTLLGRSNVNEQEPWLPRVTTTNRSTCKYKLFGLIPATLSVIAGIVLVVIMGITNSRNPEYKTNMLVLVVSILGSAAFYIIIPMSSVYLFYQIIKNEQRPRSTGITTTEQEHYSSISRETPTSRNSISQNMTRSWRDSVRWQYLLALVIVILSSLLDIGADYVEAFIELKKNVTSTSVGSQKARIISQLPSYIINSFVIIFTLEWVLRTYNNFTQENVKIKKLFRDNTNGIERGIEALRVYSENILYKKKNWREKQALINANIFSSIYVSCCLIWSLAYTYEVFNVKQIVTIGIILNCLAHLFSYGSLVAVMWLTNRAIDQMKKTALYRMSVEDQETSVDLIKFKMHINHYNPYARLFTRKTNLPSIITAIATGLISLVISFIKSGFHY